jgi:hypothetical protein
MPEFRPVAVAFDAEAKLYFVSDRAGAYRHIVAEARTITALQRKIARLLDADPKQIELRLTPGTTTKKKRG